MNNIDNNLKVLNMENLDNERSLYIEAITQEVSKILAKEEKIPLENAEHNFIHSRTYNYLAYSNDLFIEDGPEDFVDLYHNEQKYHRLVSTTQLLVEQENKN